jgi:hypothetical protein
MKQKSTETQEGFALILALLALVLLTSLGLTLAANTSTEVQIAINHRWSEQARYNSEAGLAFGKRLLANLNWNAIVPPARDSAPWDPPSGSVSNQTVATGAPLSRADAYGNASRNFEGYSCDAKGVGQGYGVILDDGTAGGPYQNISNVGGFPLNGAFTLWVRRPQRYESEDPDDPLKLQDYDWDDSPTTAPAIILVSEGIAPFSGAALTTTYAQANRASYISETLVVKGTSTPQDECSFRRGQAGANAQGTNSASCDVLTGGGAITGALPGATGVGTGNLIK